MVLGGIAEEVVLPEAVLLPAPTALTWSECAAFPVGYLTAYHGLVTRGQLKVRLPHSALLRLTFTITLLSLNTVRVHSRSSLLTVVFIHSLPLIPHFPPLFR